jgi:hypothetical protein
MSTNRSSRPTHTPEHFAIRRRRIVSAVRHSNGDVANDAFSLRNARWRTWLRAHTPKVLYYRLGFVVPKATDCGKHDWHNAGGGLDGCYHCERTRSTPPDAPWYGARLGARR